MGVPVNCKTENAIANVKHIRVCDWALLLDKLHGYIRSVPLRDQNGRTHGHAAMAPGGTV